MQGLQREETQEGYGFTQFMLGFHTFVLCDFFQIHKPCYPCRDKSYPHLFRFPPIPVGYRLASSSEKEQLSWGAVFLRLTLALFTLASKVGANIC